jgi:molybdopterin synthase catalytic subunit
MIRVQEAPFDPYAELAAFAKANAGAGAIANFIGRVRGEGDKVSALILDHYPGFTDKEIARIADEAKARFPVQGLLVIHRCGRMAPGEAIVLVAVAAAHRKSALQAVDFLMDYLKTDAPFWKREEGPGGARWIEPRGDDRAAREGWEKVRT